jgi:hypothetical protein
MKPCLVFLIAATPLLADSGVKGGLVVHVGCGDGKLTAALRANDGFIVQGLDAGVTAARQHIQSLGLYGPVSAVPWSGDRLPYADNLGQLPMSEVMRVLVPNGIALIGGRKTVKPRPGRNPPPASAARGSGVSPPRRD